MSLPNPLRRPRSDRDWPRRFASSRRGAVRLLLPVLIALFAPAFAYAQPGPGVVVPGPNTVGTGEIIDAAILAADIAAGAVTTTGILDGTILADDIAADTITANKIATGGVATAEILDGTILAQDLSAGAVTTTGILDGTIAAVDIAANQIDFAKIVNSMTLDANLSVNTAGFNWTLIGSDPSSRLTDSQTAVTATLQPLGEVAFHGSDTSTNAAGVYAAIEPYIVDAVSPLQSTVDEGGRLDFSIWRHDVGGAARVKYTPLSISNFARVGVRTVTPSAYLDVGGGAATNIDGVSDLLVADDLEVDDDVFIGGDLTVTGATNITLGANTVGTSQVTDGSLTADDLAANSVDASELAATTVTPNSYGSALVIPTYTVDADGRLTAAADVTIAGLTGAHITDDTLDFVDLDDALDVDANVTLQQTTFTWSQSFTGTTADGFSYAADNLTTGTAVSVSSNSPDTSDRHVMEVLNSNVAATDAAVLHLQQLSTDDILEAVNSGGEVLAITDAGNIVQAASLYHNFGGVEGEPGYGFRDNAGTMEWKNSGGSWASFGAGVPADSLDWSDFTDAMTLDASTTITQGANTLTFAGNRVVIDTELMLGDAVTQRSGTRLFVSDDLGEPDTDAVDFIELNPRYNYTATRDDVNHGIFLQPQANSIDEGAFTVHLQGMRVRYETLGTTNVSSIAGVVANTLWSSSGASPDFITAVSTSNEIAAGSTAVTGVVTDVAVGASVAATASVADWRGLWVVPFNGGTITNSYGIYLENLIQGTQTDVFSLYTQEGKIVVDEDGDGTYAGLTAGTTGELWFGEDQDFSVFWSGTQGVLSTATGQVQITSGGIEVGAGTPNVVDGAGGDAYVTDDLEVDDAATITGLATLGANLLQAASAYHNFGATEGEPGYGFRDNAGVMEFKDSGGSWASFGGGVGADSLDFTEFEDTLDLDANLTLAQAGFTWSQTYTGTTADAITYTFDGLTTGDGVRITSNSADTNARFLNEIVNTNALAVGAVPLKVQQNSTGDIAQFRDAGAIGVEIKDGPGVRVGSGVANFVDYSGGDIYATDDFEADGDAHIAGGLTVVGTLTATLPANSVGSSQVTDNSLTVDDVGADSVGPSELIATTVTANSYGSATAVATFTVDADGRLTTAATTTIAGLTGANLTDDTLDFVDFDDTLDLDAALTVNQSTNTWSQTFAGTTTDGFTYTADSVSTGDVVRIVSNSADTSGRNMLEVVNDNAAAVGAIGLRIQQDSDGDALRIFDGATQAFTVTDTGNQIQVAGAYQNFGTTEGEPGYGFRDNAGTVQFKNSGGSWTNFGGGGVAADSLDFIDFEDTLDLDAALTLNQTGFAWAQTFTGTTGTMQTWTANSITTGGIASFLSDSIDTGTRNLVNIVNDNTAATGTTALRVQQDSTGNIATFFDGANIAMSIRDGSGVRIGTGTAGVVDYVGGDLFVTQDVEIDRDATVSGHLAVGAQGATNQAAMLDIDEVTTAETLVRGASIEPTWNATLTASRSYSALNLLAESDAINQSTFDADVFAINAEVEVDNGSLIDDVFMIQALLDHNNTTNPMDLARGFYAIADVAASSTVSQWRGLDINMINNGTITTAYGIYITDVIEGTQTNAYGIWADEGDWILAADGGGTAGGTTGAGDLMLGASQDLELYHDGTNSWIVNNMGTLNITDSGTDPVKLSQNGGGITVGNGTASTVDGANDVYVTDDLEVDDNIIIDGQTQQRIEAIGALGSGATTFAVTSNVVTLDCHPAGNNISTITGGVAGQILTIIFLDNDCTFVDTETATANTIDIAAAFTSDVDQTFTLVHNGTKWLEVSRSVNYVAPILYRKSVGHEDLIGTYSFAA